MIPFFLAGDTSDYKLIRNWLFDIGDHMDLKLGLQEFWPMRQSAIRSETLGRQDGGNYSSI